VSVLLERLGASIRAFGDPIVLDGVPSSAFVRVYSPAEARLYLSEAAVNAAVRPIRGFFIEAGLSVAVGDVIEWLGNDYEVAFVRPYRFGGEDLGFGLIATLST